MAELRVVVAAVGWTGHALPALALARDLRSRGHEVLVETGERWRAVADDLGARFLPAAEQMSFGAVPGGGSGSSLAETAGALAAALRDFGPHLVVSDLFTLAPALAAELAGIERATLVPHPYPVPPPGFPPFSSGFGPPRGAGGRALWAAASGFAGPRRRREDRSLNAVREQLGLPRRERRIAALGDGLTLVATFPQLEYPRAWPAGVRVVGPAIYELSHDPVELPEGEAPLVVVATSTEQDPKRSLARLALGSLAEEPVRVLVSLNRDGAGWDGPVPANARVVDWAPYAQALAAASLVVTSGGHGTIVRALAAGVPVVVVPRGGDMAENGVRVAWSGVGRTLGRGPARASALRGAVRRTLADPGCRERAERVAGWWRDEENRLLAVSAIEDAASRSGQLA